MNNAQIYAAHITLPIQSFAKVGISLKSPVAHADEFAVSVIILVERSFSLASGHMHAPKLIRIIAADFMLKLSISETRKRQPVMT